MSVLTYVFNKRPSITYAITVCNEHKELKKLLSHLISKIRPKDEIVVLQDVTIPNPKVSEVLNDYSQDIIVKEAKLNSDRKSTRLNSSHVKISYAVFCLKKKKQNTTDNRMINITV